MTYLNKLTLFVVFCLNFQILAQNSRFDSLITIGVEQIYNLQYSNAESTFKIVTKEYPKSAAGLFFDAMVVWWKIMPDIMNERNDDVLIEKLDNTIDYCDKLLDKDPKNSEALFFKGGALGFRGRLYVYRESWLKAALDGKDALPLIKEAYKNDPANVDVQLGFGIYNYYIDFIPQKYPIVKPIVSLFPKGDRKKGLKQLEYVAEKGKYANYETQYFLASIYFQYEKNKTKALEVINKLVNKFPNNPAFEKYKGRILVGIKNFIDAKQLYNNILDKNNKGFTGYNKRTKREAYYHLGYISYITNNFSDAIPLLEESKKISNEIDKINDTNYKVNTLLYLGMCYDATGNRKKAMELYEMVLDCDDFSNSHNNAKKYLKSPFKN
ncbi:MAG TPA: tetratricopeptide repeat protein [Melioribacteraceae bacterium]|nr:tetratricopeptide repeat protein [Melioribacteraceae bacterium]